MAKSKKTASGTMVLVGKGSYTRGKNTLRKGGTITKEEYDALSEEKKTLFTDPKTAAKMLKAPVVADVTDEVDSNDDEKPEEK